MKIKIKGHSGCNLKIVNDNANNFIVEKTTYDLKYVERLKKQSEKQRQFNKILKIDNVIVPNVLNEISAQDKYTFSMKFYQSNDFIWILENKSYKEVLEYIDLVLKVINFNISNSSETIVSKSIFSDKLKQIKTNAFKRKLADFVTIIEEVEEELNNFDEILLPVGYCHGDLTLSNILIQDEKIVLIDFLDNFIETPLQDIVKLRQDTKHKWTLELLDRDVDKIKLDILLGYLDEYVVNRFSKYIFSDYYKFFQKINLLRILPYAKEKRIIEYLQVELNKL